MFYGIMEKFCFGSTVVARRGAVDIVLVKIRNGWSIFRSEK